MAHNDYPTLVLSFLLITLAATSGPVIMADARNLLEVNLPELPLPELPEPELPELPHFPGLPELHFPTLPSVELPEFPSFGFPGFTKPEAASTTNKDTNEPSVVSSTTTP